MSETLKAYRLHQDSMGGHKDSEFVYTDEQVAHMVCEDHPKEEFSSWSVKEVSVRVIAGNEGAIGRELVTINRTTAKECLRDRALRKLSKAEKEALGI